MNNEKQGFPYEWEALFALDNNYLIITTSHESHHKNHVQPVRHRRHQER